MIEFETVWDASWLPLLKTNVEPTLEDISFEIYETQLKLTQENGETSTFCGQSFIKVLIEDETPNFFKNQLKDPVNFNKNFVQLLRHHIYINFEYDLYRII